MWSISEVKEKGKANMKANYWMSVVAGLIMTLAIGGAGTSVGSSSSGSARNSFSAVDEGVMALIIALITVLSVILIVAILFDIFVLNPLEVGCQNFFIRNSRTQNGEFGDIGRGFKPSWLANVKTLFLRDLFIVLWGCLFIIPGIVKSYSYRMVPYILADHPEINGTDAITLSRKMMNGHKMQAFLFDLSYFGWAILSILTCGILLTFYVNPYYYNAAAQIYEALKVNEPELNTYSA